MSWLPPDFEHPERVELPTGHHLRPIRESDVSIDYPAVMGSRERLWATFGAVWGWPRATMTFAEDRADLARHEREQHAHRSYNYAVLDPPASQLLGCVYIDPAERVGADADVSWWLIDDESAGPLEATLRDFIPRWIVAAWPFTAPRFIGRITTAASISTPTEDLVAEAVFCGCDTTEGRPAMITNADFRIPIF